MIDLSNNNGVGHDFARAYASGHHRAYFKASEGVRFRDPDFTAFVRAAGTVGFKCGGYHFARPHRSSAKDEAAAFVRVMTPQLPKLKLRPVLDLEDGRPSTDFARWAREWLDIVRSALGVQPLIYSYGSYLEGCSFGTPVADLWLASYGRDDGVEHPYRVPRPWIGTVAHQYSSQGRVPGIRGPVDVSSVSWPAAVDLGPRL